MKTEEEIRQEIRDIEQQALEKIREGRTNLSYKLVYRIQALNWVLENEENKNE